jgi:hypothetical protein
MVIAMPQVEAGLGEVAASIISDISPPESQPVQVREPFEVIQPGVRYSFTGKAKFLQRHFKDLQVLL